MWWIRTQLKPSLAAFGAGLGVALFSLPAWAAPSPTPSPTATASAAQPTSATPGEKVCTIMDPRLRELSGMLAVGRFIYVHNDSTRFAAANRVFKLDRDCQIVGLPIPYAAPTLDPEDMALGRNGEIWIADTGDSGLNPVRNTIALWKMVQDKITGPYRLSYPSTKYDAEALLIGSDGIPIVITKNWDSAEGKTRLFSPIKRVSLGKTVPMKQVGELTLPHTGTPTTLGPVGRRMVTGAAQAPNHSNVTLRTYADALEWDVTGGDIVAALTTGEPRVTALPDEPWGEAITYSADGKKLLTVSETVHLKNTDPNKSPVILSYTPTAKPFVAPSQVAGPNTADEATEQPRHLSLFSSIDQVYLATRGVGVFGLILVLLGIFGVVNAFKGHRRAAEQAPEKDEEPADDSAPSTAVDADARGDSD
jgi:hypothetical protein